MKWGRNESVIWPPHGPVNTYGAIFLFRSSHCALLFTFDLRSHSRHCSSFTCPITCAQA